MAGRIHGLRVEVGGYGERGAEADGGDCQDPAPGAEVEHAPERPLPSEPLQGAEAEPRRFVGARPEGPAGVDAQTRHALDGRLPRGDDAEDSDPECTEALAEAGDPVHVRSEERR